MKNVIAATLFLTIFFISIPCGTSSNVSACGPQLMQKLLETCGRGGTKSMKYLYMMSRYRRHYYRTQKIHRGKRDISEYAPSFIDLQMLSANHLDQIATSSSSRLSAFVEAGSLLNKRRKRNVRVRRQIHSDCCVKKCSTAHLRKAYCQRRGG